MDLPGKPVRHLIRLSSRTNLALFAALVLSACTTQPAPVPVAFDGAAYRTFLTPAPLLPLRLEGSIAINLQGKRESGEMHFRATHQGVSQLQMLARLTGSLAIEVRFDQHWLILLDFLNESYLRLPNTPLYRERLFLVDLSPDEFQILLTGRVPLPIFQRGKGKQDAHSASFDMGQAQHRFQLNEQGLPAVWTKTVNGTTAFRVEYRDYLSMPLTSKPAANGAPFYLPRKIRLYRQGKAPLMVLGISQASLGNEPEAPQLSTRELPPGTRDFRPGTLRDL